MMEEVNSGDTKNGDVEKATNYTQQAAFLPVTNSDEAANQKDMTMYSIFPSRVLQQPPSDIC